MSQPDTGAADLTHDDEFVAATDNGLRSDDLELDQPSQDPDVVPESIIDEHGQAVAG